MAIMFEAESGCVTVQITDWLRLVNRLNPDITELIEIGTSYNGKPMLLIKVRSEVMHCHQLFFFLSCDLTQTLSLSLHIIAQRLLTVVRFKLTQFLLMFLLSS